MSFFFFFLGGGFWLHIYVRLYLHATFKEGLNLIRKEHAVKFNLSFTTLDQGNLNRYNSVKLNGLLSSKNWMSSLAVLSNKIWKCSLGLQEKATVQVLACQEVCQINQKLFGPDLFNVKQQQYKVQT